MVNLDFVTRTSYSCMVDDLMQHKFEMYVLVNKYVLSMLYNILQIKLVIKKN